MPDLHNVVNIYSILIFYNQFRRKTVNAFYVEFGYAMSGNKENIIYLNLTVGEMNPDISVFNKITTKIYRTAYRSRSKFNRGNDRELFQ